MDARLYPREHGAYAQLGFPLLGALVLGSPGAGSLLFAAAAILLFLANEPLVVLLGMRGQRLREELRIRARLALGLRGALGTAAGIAALWLAPTDACWLVLVPVVLVMGLVPIVLSKALKSLPGEFVAAAAFASMHLPVAAAGGVAGTLLWSPPAMWFVVFAVATLCVHGIKSRITGRRAWTIPAAPWAARIALFLALVLSAFVPHWRPAALAALLPLGAVLLLARLAPSTRRLKQVGWSLVAANALALAVLAAASRVA